MALYCEFTRKILEYRPFTLDPHTASNLTQFKQVQCKFLNWASHTLNINYPLRDYTSVLQQLGIESLANRRHSATFITYVNYFLSRLSILTFFLKSLLEPNTIQLFYIISAPFSFINSS